MEIKRDRYLNKMVSFMRDGQVKVISGIRRCGKSYLLCNLFRDCVFEREKSQGRASQTAREIAFVANAEGRKIYIRSVYALGTEEQAIAENKPLPLTGDSFPKIIVRHDIRRRWYDDNGVLNIGIPDFLLDDAII